MQYSTNLRINTYSIMNWINVLPKHEMCAIKRIENNCYWYIPLYIRSISIEGRQLLLYFCHPSGSSEGLMLTTDTYFLKLQIIKRTQLEKISKGFINSTNLKNNCLYQICFLSSYVLPQSAAFMIFLPLFQIDMYIYLKFCIFQEFSLFPEHQIWRSHPGYFLY